MNIVIGSGPAGVACAEALLARGEPVTILDAGQNLEAHRQAVVDRFASDRPGPDANMAELRGDVGADSSGLVRKLTYGSDFPYRRPAMAGKLISRGVALEPSYAVGGLSNVWGAALLPYQADEFSGWPISRDDLEGHYQAALGMVPVSAVPDELGREFPLYDPPQGALDPGDQGRAILSHLARKRDRLAERGISFGRSRLAVRVVPGDGKPGCQYCGQCLTGCPWGLIYNSVSSLQKLRAAGALYESGLIVETVGEEAEAVRVSGRSVDGERFQRSASRVFLAAGVINTTRIILQSTDRFDTPVRIQDSRYFLLPLVGTHPPGDRYHTLSQAFLEVQAPEVCSRRVHLQVYGYNDLYVDAVRESLGPAGALAPRIARQLFAIQGYLHSELSPGISVRLTGGAASPELVLDAEDDGGGSRGVIRRVVRHLARNTLNLGLLPLSPMLRLGEPGRGFHSGGSFPMARRPSTMESDVLGRPVGLRRVHAVDSTVLTNIPAGPITLTVMANARRIADEALSVVS